MRGVIEAVPSLHAQALVVDGTRASVGVYNAVFGFVNVVCDRATNSTVGTYGINGLEGGRCCSNDISADVGARGDVGTAGVVPQRGDRQRPGRAGLFALPARDAGRGAHRVVEVEADPGRVALSGAANDVVDLHVVAGADAAVAQDTGLVIHPDDLRRTVDRTPVAGGKATRVGAVRRGQGRRHQGEAAAAIGAAWPRILFIHIVPHLWPTLLVWGTLGIATTVLLEATLSFLGVGVRPPTPSWGGIIYESQSYFLDAPWLVFFPGIAIMLLSLSFNLVGDALRDALDPTQRGRD